MDGGAASPKAAKVQDAACARLHPTLDNTANAA